MTLAELLEALDSGVSGLCGKLQTLARELDAARRDAAFSGETGSPETLRVRMQLAGITKADFVALFGIPAAAVDEWLSGSRPAPGWVLPCIRLLEQVPPAARARALHRRAPQNGGRGKSSNSHPFSRIEEL